MPQLPILPALGLPLLVVLPEVTPAAGLGGSQGPDLTRYLLVCAGLLLLVGGLAWAARRFLTRTLRDRAAKRSLQVVDMLPLGSKQRLAVVRCYDRTFLLGLGEKEVSLVSELDAVIAPARPGATTSLEERSFADLLNRAEPGGQAARVAAPAPRSRIEREGILG